MPPAAALQRLKDAQQARKLTELSQGQQQSRLAADSDADNEAYMQQFEHAFSSMSTAGQLSMQQPAAAGTSLQPGLSMDIVATINSSKSGSVQAAVYGRVQHSSTECCVSMASGVSSKGVPCTICLTPPSTTGQCHSSRTQCSAPGANRVKERSNARKTHTLDTRVMEGLFPRAVVAPGWRTGPTNAAGVVVQLSDRPLMCSAATWASNEVVVGCSDHASYVVDVATGKKRRTLFTRTTGHTEWVTCVCYLPGGRILSGGMDGRLWLWPAGGSAGIDIPAAHAAPVSKVACLTSPATDTAAGHGNTGPRGRGASSSSRAATAAGAVLVLAASCSYDKTVKIWDVSGSRGKQAAVLTGHSGPVLELAVNEVNSIIATGDRKGGLMCWDLVSGKSSWGAASAHQGHITALAWQQDYAAVQHCDSTDRAYLVSGGQDGCVLVWDGRNGDCVSQQAVHVSQKGKGAVGNILTGCGGSTRLLVTTGADMTLKVLDPAVSYKPVHTVQLTDFPYSLAGIGQYVVCGCGDGSVHVIDVDSGSTRYALGAGKAAIRAIEVSTNKLVCAGDDGYVISYDFC